MSESLVPVKSSHLTWAGRAALSWSDMTVTVKGLAMQQTARCWHVLAQTFWHAPGLGTERALLEVLRLFFRALSRPLFPQRCAWLRQRLNSLLLGLDLRLRKLQLPCAYLLLPRGLDLG